MDPVVDLQIWRYRLPLAEPLHVGSQELNQRQGFVLRLTGESGAVGWGEVAPLPEFSRETLDETAGQLNKLRQSRLNELPPAHLSELIASTEESARDPWRTYDFFPSVRFGVEQGLLCLEASRRGVSVPGLLRETPPPHLPVNGLLVDQPKESLLESTETMIEEGYRSVKLKVGRRPLSDDIQRVHAVSEALRNRASLRLDANRKWDFPTALTFAKRVSDCAIEYLEEPLDVPDQMEVLAAGSSIPLALDETIRAVEPPDLNHYPFARAVVLKPTLIGGFLQTSRYVRTARKYGMMPVISASFESGLGLLGLAWLAAGLNLDSIPAGLDTGRWFARDLLDPSVKSRRGVLHGIDIAPGQLTLNRQLLTPL